MLFSTKLSLTVFLYLIDDCIISFIFLLFAMDKTYMLGSLCDHHMDCYHIVEHHPYKRTNLHHINAHDLCTFIDMAVIRTLLSCSF